MLTILDDPKEVMKGLQKELNSLKEMGVVTAVMRTTAAGKRAIQTRRVDREKDGCVKSRLVLKDINHSHGRMQTEMFAPTPSTLSLATSSHDRNNDPEYDYVAIAIDVHTAFLHADIDQDLYAEPQEESQLNEDEEWKLHKALCRYKKAPKLWHQHVVTILENLNIHSLLTVPNCFRNDDLDINIFIHVDDGLLFGPNSELQRLIEHLSSQVMMRVVGKTGATERPSILSGQSDHKNSPW